MLLAVDIGNTQVALGLFHGSELRTSWRLRTAADKTADEVHLDLAGQFGLKGLDLACVEDVVIASVVPALTPSWTETAKRVTGTEPLVVGPQVKTSLALHFDNPDEIGADRIADAVAAIEQVGSPAVIVDLGTATNIEVIDKEGRFIGGVIAPGLATSADALFSHAARIPQSDLAVPDTVIGTNTADAVRSGLVLGEAERIDGLVRRIFDELGYQAPVIATGGFANTVCQLSRTIDRHDPDLTLTGLRLIYDLNHQEEC